LPGEGVCREFSRKVAAIHAKTKGKPSLIAARLLKLSRILVVSLDSQVSWRRGYFPL